MMLYQARTVNSSGKAGRNDRIKRQSLSILRHKANKLGIQMSSQGWVKLDDLAAALRRNPVTIKNVADKNTSRLETYTDSSGCVFIRATYGHSDGVPKIVLEQDIPPAELFYGHMDWLFCDVEMDSGKNQYHILFSSRKALQKHRPLNRYIYRTNTAEQSCTFHKVSDDIWLASGLIKVKRVGYGW